VWVPKYNRKEAFSSYYDDTQTFGREKYIYIVHGEDIDLTHKGKKRNNNMKKAKKEYKGL
jgi:hypothetical protein